MLTGARRVLPFALMAVHILPATYDLTATNDDQIDAERGQAIVAGDSYVLDVTVQDENGDPFDAGTQVAPYWEIEASLRDDWVFDGGTVQASFVCAWTNAPIGQARLTLTPTLTTALTVASGKWDLQIRNKSSGGDPGYDAGFVQTVLRGSWALMKDATRA